MVSVGQMRMVIKFEQVVKSTDDTGGQNEVYDEWFTTRGYMEQEKTFRSFETGYDQSVKTYKCYVLWRHEFEQGISKDVRVVFESRSFSIDSFDLVKQQRKMYLLKLTEVR